jgi:thiol-disulfide isomerase/thioredoxin
MKKSLLFCIILMFAVNGWGQQFKSIAIGTKVPMAETKMKSIDGKEIAIKDVSKKNGVLVMFSCNTCPVVKKYQARTLEAIRQAEENGFGVIIVNSNEGGRNEGDSYSAMQQYAKAQPYKDVPYVVDNNSVLANAFGASRTPECYLFDARGYLVYHGAIDDNQEAAHAQRNHLAVAMGEVSTGQPVSVKETRSVGCGIKRPE